MTEDKSVWVTKKQLDIPLCDIFEGTKTKRTARTYVRMCEAILGLKKADLESMEFEEMNRYIDSFDSRLDAIL